MNTMVKGVGRLLMSVAVLYGLSSCSQTIPPTPPATLTDKREIKAYQKALAGDAESMYYVGLCYLTGTRGYPQDARMGANAFEIAAKGGHTEAMVFIGNCYEAGYGRFGNRSTALSYYKKAADRGSADGRKHYRRLTALIQQEEEEARARARNSWNAAASEYNNVMGGAGLIPMPYMN